VEVSRRDGTWKVERKRGSEDEQAKEEKEDAGEKAKE
jgi:hypothetical protein